MGKEQIRYRRGIKGILLFLLAVTFLIFTAPDRVKASGAVNVSVSSASGDVGSQVTVSVNVSADSNVSGTDFQVNFDPAVLSLADGSGSSSAHIADISTYKDKTFSLTFNVVGAGSSAVSVASSSAQFISEDEDVMAVNASSGTVTGTVATTASSGNTNSGNSGSSNSGSSDSGSSDFGSSDSGNSDSGSSDTAATTTAAPVLDGNTSLSSLDVYPGGISFSSDVHSYSFEVPQDTDSLQVSASAASGTSSVSVSGTSLSMGANTVVITVTAENGATSEYVLNVTRGGETTTEATTTETTTEAISTEPETTVPTVTVLGTVVSPERTFDILELTSGTKVPAGFSQTTVTIGGSDYTAYRSNDGTVIFYGRPASDDDTDFAGVGWYVYDAADGSIQAAPARLTETTAATSTTKAAAAESTEKVVDYRWKGIACVMGLAALVLLILLIVMLIRRKGPHDGDFDGEDLNDAVSGGGDSDDDLPDEDVTESPEYGDSDELDDILSDDYDDEEQSTDDLSAQAAPHMTLEPDEKALSEGVNRIMAEDDGLETLDIDDTDEGK